MTIEYEENTDDLLTRIDIHERFGARNIDEWMMELLDPAPDARVLDVACGAGKQLALFDKHLGGSAKITGGDVNAGLLEAARERCAGAKNDTTILPLDFNEPFPFDDASFDLLTCCFAIYYATDITSTVEEMYRILDDGGQLFFTGPLPDNKALFYEIITEATGHTIPVMPGSSRFSTEILDAVVAKFPKAHMHHFENPLTFPTVDPFIEYTKASLAEDRKLWAGLFSDSEGFDEVIAKIREVAGRRLEAEGQLVMTKTVGGILAQR